MFRFLVCPLARVPVESGFLARRIEGPTLASNHLWCIDADTAIVAVQHLMEKAELDSRIAFLRQKIQEPVEKLNAFLSSVYPLIGATNPKDLPGVVAIQTQSQALSQSLNEKVSRWRVGHVVKGEISRRQVKLQSQELRTCLQKCTVLVRAFYEQRVFPHMGPDVVASFWTKKQLNQDDWPGLCEHLLRKAVNPDIMTPIEESDDQFSLKIDALDASAYVNMLLSSCPRDHMEKYAALLVPSSTTVKPTVPDMMYSHMAERPDLRCSCVAQSSESQFIAKSVKVQGAASSDGHGINLVLKGTKVP